MASIVQLSAMLPKDAQFRTWLSTVSEVDELTADEAAEIVRIVCQIDSRRQLAQDREAEARFHALLRKPFCAWREQQPA
jgi:hypothetical protein